MSSSVASACFELIFFGSFTWKRMWPSSSSAISPFMAPRAAVMSCSTSEQSSSASRGALDSGNLSLDSFDPENEFGFFFDGMHFSVDRSIPPYGIRELAYTKADKACHAGAGEFDTCSSIVRIVRE